MAKLRILLAFALIAVSLLGIGFDFFSAKGTADNNSAIYPGKSGFETP